MNDLRCIGNHLVKRWWILTAFARLLKLRPGLTFPAYIPTQVISITGRTDFLKKQDLFFSKKTPQKKKGGVFFFFFPGVPTGDQRGYFSITSWG